MSGSTDCGLSADPHDRMGVFKRLSDVPDRYQLHHHADAYAGRDVWDEYLQNCVFAELPDATEKFNRSVQRAGERWAAHTEERGRHHALATPEDVETWCVSLRERLTLGTAYGQYWQRVEGFYTWLQHHPDHPHVYHPVLMAVATGPAAREIWNHKLSRGNRTGGTWDE